MNFLRDKHSSIPIKFCIFMLCLGESLMIFLGEMIPKLKTRQVAQNNQGQPVNTTGNEKQKKKKK
jgi:hypothetical protein